MSLNTGSSHRTFMIFSYNLEENHRITQEWLEQLRGIGPAEYSRRNTTLAARLLSLIETVKDSPEIVSQPAFHETTLEELDRLDPVKVDNDIEPLTVDMGCEHVGRVYAMYPFTLFGVRIYQSIWGAIYSRLTEEEKDLVMMAQVKGDLEDVIKRHQEIHRYLKSFGVQEDKVF